MSITLEGYYVTWAHYPVVFLEPCILIYLSSNAFAGYK